MNQIEIRHKPIMSIRLLSQLKEDFPKKFKKEKKSHITMIMANEMGTKRDDPKTSLETGVSIPDPMMSYVRIPL